MSVLSLAYLFPIPFTRERPSTKTLPRLFTKVVYYPAHDTCLTFATAILVGFTSPIVFVIYDTPIFLEDVLTLLSPHI